MYLLDTNIISELRKRDRANPGIIRFIRQIAERETTAYLSVITIGELRRGVDMINSSIPSSKAILSNRLEKIRSIITRLKYFNHNLIWDDRLIC